MSLKGIGRTKVSKSGAGRCDVCCLSQLMDNATKYGGFRSGVAKGYATDTRAEQVV